MLNVPVGAMTHRLFGSNGDDACVGMSITSSFIEMISIQQFSVFNDRFDFISNNVSRGYHLEFASAVWDYSSQAGSYSWSANQALGPPNVYPNQGSSPMAWVPVFDNSSIDVGQSIEFSIEPSAVVCGVWVFQSAYPGGIKSVTFSGQKPSYPFNNATNSSILTVQFPCRGSGIMRLDYYPNQSLPTQIDAIAMLVRGDDYSEWPFSSTSFSYGGDTDDSRSFGNQSAVSIGWIGLGFIIMMLGVIAGVVIIIRARYRRFHHEPGHGRGHAIEMANFPVDQPIGPITYAQLESLLYRGEGRSYLCNLLKRTVPFESLTSVRATFTSTECVCCLENTPTVLLMPCMHAILCVDCDASMIFTHMTSGSRFFRGTSANQIIDEAWIANFVMPKLLREKAFYSCPFKCGPVENRALISSAAV